VATDKTPKDKYVELMHRLCEHIIRNEGTPDAAEDRMWDKLEELHAGLDRSEQDEVDEVDWCGHPDGWLAEELMTKGRALRPDEQEDET
jgi:hypothetical protein